MRKAVALAVIAVISANLSVANAEPGREMLFGRKAVEAENSSSEESRTALFGSSSKKHRKKRGVDRGQDVAMAPSGGPDSDQPRTRLFAKPAGANVAIKDDDAGEAPSAVLLERIHAKKSGSRRSLAHVPVDSQEERRQEAVAPTASFSEQGAAVARRSRPQGGRGAEGLSDDAKEPGRRAVAGASVGLGGRDSDARRLIVGVESKGVTSQGISSTALATDRISRSVDETPARPGVPQTAASMAGRGVSEDAGLSEAIALTSDVSMSAKTTQRAPGSDVYSERRIAGTGGLSLGFYSGHISQRYTADLQYLGVLNSISRRSGIVLKPAYAVQGPLFDRQIRARTFDVLAIGAQYFAVAKAAGYVPVLRATDPLDVVLLIKKSSGFAKISDTAGKRIAVVDPVMLPFLKSAGVDEPRGTKFIDTFTGDVAMISNLVHSADYDGVLVSSATAYAVKARAGDDIQLLAAGRPRHAYAWWVRSVDVSNGLVKKLVKAVESNGEGVTVGRDPSAELYKRAFGISPRFTPVMPEDFAELMGEAVAPSLPR